MTFGGYFMNDFWWVFYEWFFVAILLMAIGVYSFISHWWLFY
jgi:hypothetical protein